MKQIVPLFLLFIAVSLCAFGSKLNGTYAGRLGGELGVTVSYTFKSNGKVVVSALDEEHEGNYEVDGNKVKITGLPSGGTLVMTLLEDGSIQGPMGIKLTKQKK